MCMYKLLHIFIFNPFMPITNNNLPILIVIIKYNCNTSLNEFSTWIQYKHYLVVSWERDIHFSKEYCRKVTIQRITGCG